MEHQDWEPVIFHNPKKEKYENEKKKSSSAPVISKKTKELMNTNDVVLPPKISAEFKKTMQSARNSQKISQKQLANLLQVPTKTIMDYENGKAIPNNQFISRMEKILKTKLPRCK